MNYEEIYYLLGNVLGGIMIGSLCGIAPLILGIVKKRILLGISGMFVCVILGVTCTVVFDLPAFMALAPAIATILLIIFYKTKKKK